MLSNCIYTKNRYNIYNNNRGVTMDKISIPTMYDFLYEEFMKPYHVSSYRLAKDIGVPVSRIQDILHGRRGVSAETSILLGAYFGVSETFFLKIQMDIDLRKAKEKLGDSLNRVKPINK